MRCVKFGSDHNFNDPNQYIRFSSRFDNLIVPSDIKEKRIIKKLFTCHELEKIKNSIISDKSGGLLNIAPISHSPVLDFSIDILHNDGFKEIFR